jgi:cell division protein FtsN
MKKYTLICIGLCAAMAFTSCKSSESAYKKAYEKAKQYDTQTAQQEAVAQEAVVAPVEAKPVTQAQVVDNLDNISVRQESVQLIHGNGLNAFSVVVGSFGLLSNAESLYQRLKDAGYDAQIVKNEDKNMFRVVASTYNDKGSAAASRDQLRATYPDAWLLYFGQ